MGLGEGQRGGLCQQRGEVRQVHVPFDRLRALLECTAMLAQETLQVLLVTPQVAECLAMLERERQRFEGVIEAQQVNRARDVPGGPQSRERIGRRPEADRKSTRLNSS